MLLHLTIFHTALSCPYIVLKCILFGSQVPGIHSDVGKLSDEVVYVSAGLGTEIVLCKCFGGYHVSIIRLS